MSAAIPQPVQEVLNEYIALAQAALPGLLTGVYVHGSLALNAFNPGLSDIDFISITSRRCTATDIDSLRALHYTLAQRFPQAQLEGCYLLSQDVGRFEDTMPPHPYVHDGSFEASGYHDINAVTWWILKNRGIAIYGPSPDRFDIHINWERLLVKMHHNLNTYWASFTTNPQRMAWLLKDYGVQWAVLGVLRQFYTFREHAITSKAGAGAYGLVHTPQQWHQLIQAAINFRAGSPGSSYRFRIVRAIAARAFLQLVITACNT
jgi:aminoglycoside adenylyltransferase-like protein